MSHFHLTYSLPLHNIGRNIRLYPEDGTTIFLRNVDTKRQNYTSSKRKMSHLHLRYKKHLGLYFETKVMHLHSHSQHIVILWKHVHSFIHFIFRDSVITYIVMETTVLGCELSVRHPFPEGCNQNLIDYIGGFFQF